MSKAILVDTTKCIGCGACATACKIVNDLPLDDAEANKERPAPSAGTEELVAFAQAHGEVGGKLSATTLNAVESRGSVFVRKFCMHCQDPTCASVCPVGALRKTAAGPVIYDADRCMGCRYCMMACPFGIPRYEWKSALPKVQKCILCAPRLAKGLQPACTEVCPVQAGIFGERDELLREAAKRLGENPAAYVQHVYGQEEVGGTSILYLSAVPFEQLGFPANLPHDALPMYTYRVLSKIPNLVMLGGALLGGIWWITNRREAVAEAEQAENRNSKNETRNSQLDSGNSNGETRKR